VKRETTRAAVLVEDVRSLARQHERETSQPLVHLRTRRGAGRFVRDAQVIRANLPPGSRVLDLGCGAGQMAYVLQRLGFDVVAADIEKDPPPFVRFIPGNDDLEVVPYIPLDPDGSTERLGGEFDGVCLSGVLEHVQSFGGFVEQTFGLTRTNGLVFIFHFPNRYSWIEAINDRKPGYQTHHPLRFTPRELSLMVRWHGFRVIETKYEEILPVNLTHLPGPLRGFFERHDQVLSVASLTLLHLPLVKRLSTSFRVVAVKADNWPVPGQH
jgi:SAM-dependent methyltransferase